MRSVRVFGGLPASRTKPAPDIVLDPALPRGVPGHVTVNLHRLVKQMVSDLPPRLTDLLEVASYVYAADQFVRRDSPKMPRMGADWHRSFEFHIAVRDPAFWTRSDVQGQLVDTLRFLSGDSYAFSFKLLQPRAPQQAFLQFDADGPASGFAPDEVLLFSGGLDSFAGALDAVLAQDRRVALVSHQASPLVAKFQRKLVAELRSRIGPERLLHLSVGVTRGSQKAVEFTQRTRSFLFAVLGFVVARLFGRDRLSFYENGVVSLNLPLASHVIGSRASRTTHPKALHDFGVLFSLVSGRDIQVNNPFFWQTKAEVVGRIAELGCGSLIPETFSCASVRKATKMGGRHCGICSQCIDRRFGILAAGCARFEPAGHYGVDLFRGERQAGASTIMAEAYVLTAARNANSSELGFLTSYPEVLRATRYVSQMPETEVLARLHRLHQRHGAAVSRVVAEHMADVEGVSGRLSLPDNSLLAMIMGSQAQDIVVVDPAELEPSAAVQAEVRPDRTLPRPVTFSILPGEGHVAFAGGVSLRGKQAALFRALYSRWRSGSRAVGDPIDVAYARSKDLAVELQITEVALRKLVARVRVGLKQQFRERFEGSLEDGDVIENGPWHGYRLNPRLAFSPMSEELAGLADAAE